jgi:hypothetical protein
VPILQLQAISAKEGEGGGHWQRCLGAEAEGEQQKGELEELHGKGSVRVMILQVVESEQGERPEGGGEVEASFGADELCTASEVEAS